MSDIYDQSKYLDEDGFITLKRRYSELFQKINYTTDLDIVLNRIFEYDIRSANVSVMKASGKMKEETLDKLTLVSKNERNVKVGLMIKRNHDIQTIISKGIIEAKRKLFEANQIQDSDILSIKNDAVFVIGRKLQKHEFGSVYFVLKNSFSLYLRLNKIEFYYDKKNSTVVVKGINDDVVNELDHQNGIITFFSKVFEYIVYGRMQDLKRYLIEFSEDYKALKLPYQFYREFNNFNIYRSMIQLEGFEYNLLTINDDEKDSINIAYNYNRFILPLIQKYI